MKRALVIAVAAASLVLAGCTAGPSPEPPAPTEPAVTEQLFTITGTLFDDKREPLEGEVRSDGPQICWFVRTSNPPRCGSGMSVEGVDWDEYAGIVLGDAETVRWAEVTIVGSFDGERLTLVEPPVVADETAYGEPIAYPPGTLDPTELARIREEIQAAEHPPISGQGDGFVTVTVVYDDDGALQKRLDALYGVGAVYVESLLTPVS